MHLRVKLESSFSFSSLVGGFFKEFFMYDFQPFYDVLTAMSKAVVPALLVVFLVGLTLSWVSDL